MIRNFDVIKEQLKDLSSVINSFKSEAVQLRLIELVFEKGGSDDEHDEAHTKNKSPVQRQAGRKSVKTPPTTGTPKAKASGRPGGKAMLERLHSEGFFKKPKTIKQLVEHCEHNLAFKYRQSDFSGPLGRLTRDGKLKREKNVNKQYEYSET
ncbi:MAG TPA: hypothetical protein PLO37_04280 [Candidatus Hydrogenedentes bacterium]|nr:hypothetical protein [Candidatus Hydrogenedentota bacterium]HPG66042.1 hypothetical protein [Candidatus Hydrogenedentota bacterium]